VVLAAEKIYQRVEHTPLKGIGGYYQLLFEAMGTTCQVFFSSRTRAQADTFKRAILRWVAEFEAKYSRFIESSLVSRANRAAGREWVETDGQTEELFALCDWFHWMTEGVFDPTTEPLLKLWDYHKKPHATPSPAEIEMARGLMGWTRIQRGEGRVFLPTGTSIDLGGVGKEFAVDEVTELALSMGITNILVDFGHDLRVHGEPPEKGPWRIGLESPDSPGRCYRGVAVTNAAVCTSGDYLRHIEVDSERYGHIVDPRTGYPARNGTKAVTVVAASCTEAGVLATTAFILGPEKGLELISRHPTAEGCLWTENGVFETRGFRHYVIEH
jgi:FAD:protein FMN transferase